MTTPLPRLAIALDAPSLEPVEPLLDALHGLPVLIKVGLSLYTAVGPSVVHHMRLAGFAVFLDLKLHDIPHQVALAVAAASRLGVDLLTVHAAGGLAMLQAAAAAAHGQTRIIGVTVLTSMDQSDLAQTQVNGDLRHVVAERARLCQQAGLNGVVLGAPDLHELLDFPRQFLRVVPGIRLPDAVADDQRRTATPAEAMAAGASLLVVGRPITMAADPRAQTQAILAAMG